MSTQKPRSREGPSPASPSLLLLLALLLVASNACQRQPPEKSDSASKKSSTQGPGPGRPAVAKSTPKPPPKIEGPEALSKGGHRLAREGKYGQAMMVWTRLLDTHGPSISAKIRAKTAHDIAKACLRLKRRNDALEWLRLAVLDDPENTAASALLKKLLVTKRPQNPRLRLSERVREWIEHFDGRGPRPTMPETTKGKKPSTPPPLDPVKDFREALKKGIETARAHYGLGLVLAHRKETRREAQRHLIRAIGRNNENVLAYLRLADLYEKDGRYDRQRKVLRKSWAVGNRDLTTTLHLARALARSTVASDDKLFRTCTKEVLAADAKLCKTILAKVTDPARKKVVTAWLQELETYAAQRDALQEVRTRKKIRTYDTSWHTGGSNLGWGSGKPRKPAAGKGKGGITSIGSLPDTHTGSDSGLHSGGK